MSEGSDDSERKLENQESNKEGATGDSASPSASPRDKKTRLLTTDGGTSIPVSRGRPLRAQDLLVAGRAIYFTSQANLFSRSTNVTSDLLT